MAEPDQAREAARKLLNRLGEILDIHEPRNGAVFDAEDVLITAINEATKAAHAATAPAFRDLGTALRMIRDAVEELGPVGACSVSRDHLEPRPIDDAEMVIACILKTIELAKHEAAQAERRAVIIADQIERGEQ